MRGPVLTRLSGGWGRESSASPRRDSRGARGVEVKVSAGLRRSWGCASTALGAEEETEAQGNPARVTQLVRARTAAGTLSLDRAPFRARGPTPAG